MEFQFDIKKTMASIAFLAERGGGQVDMFLSLKTLYVADKKALTQWGKTITGDSFRALKNGPVLWMVYKLFKGTAPVKFQRVWNAHFTERMNHSIHLRSKVPVDVLSLREMDALSDAQAEINEMAPWDVADWLHQTCPEWKDPGDHSLPISPVEILANAGRSVEQIRRLSESEHDFQQAKHLLGVG
jgi:uncharacterized phage-associated protein